MLNVLFIGLFIILHESIEDLPGCFKGNIKLTVLSHW